VNCATVDSFPRQILELFILPLARTAHISLKALHRAISQVQRSLSLSLPLSLRVSLALTSPRLELIYIAFARHAPSAKKGEGALRARTDVCARRGVKSHREVYS